MWCVYVCLQIGHLVAEMVPARWSHLNSSASVWSGAALIHRISSFGYAVRTGRPPPRNRIDARSVFSAWKYLDELNKRIGAMIVDRGLDVHFELLQ